MSLVHGEDEDYFEGVDPKLFTPEEIKKIKSGDMIFVDEVDNTKPKSVADYPWKEAITTNPKDILGVKKVSLHLIPPASKIYQATAMEDGAKKYGPYNWRGNKVRLTVYLDAAERHLACYLDGEEIAEDSGVHHLAHALGCIGILVDAKETGNLIDDRPKCGIASQLIDKLKKEKDLKDDNYADTK